MTIVEPLPEKVDPERAWRAFAGLPGRVVLESLEAGPGTGRWTLLAAAPEARVVFEDERVVLVDDAGTRERVDEHANPFEGLRHALAACAVDRADAARASEPAGVPFVGGAIGFLSYELARRLHRAKLPAPRADVDPPLWLGIYPAALLIERESGRGFLVGSDTRRTSATEAVAKLRRLLASEPRGGSAGGAFPGADERAASAAEHVRAARRDAFRVGVERIREHIAAGDLYQVNLSARFETDVDGGVDVLWPRLRPVSPEPFAACIETEDRAVLSASMERLLEVRGRAVETRPIKGTIARGDTREADGAAKARLLASEKDRAELLMIVDIHRNDLGKVCEPGSIDVPALFEVRTFAHVHHLEATVRGTLRENADAIDALAAVFPAGSITGAPKLKAMQVIEELEPNPRGVYCGAIGYLGFDGNADFAVAIRTAVLQDHRLRYSAGGGIVWDSDPDAEWQEVEAKAVVFRKLSRTRTRRN